MKQQQDNGKKQSTTSTEMNETDNEIGAEKKQEMCEELKAVTSLTELTL